MTNREHFLSSLIDEANICKHIYTKLTPESLEYRPTSGQRSAIELLRYLSHIGIGSMDAMVNGGWEGYKSYKDRAADMPADEFPAAMDRQIEEMTALFNSIPDEDLRTKEAKLPTGQTLPLGDALMKSAYAWMVAYKMQLFLYTKASGATDMTTANCWMGMDWTPKPKVEEPVAEAATEEAAA